MLHLKMTERDGWYDTLSFCFQLLKELIIQQMNWFLNSIVINENAIVLIFHIFLKISKNLSIAIFETQIRYHSLTT